MDWNGMEGGGVMGFTAIALGTNLGKREENLKNARERLETILQEAKFSSVYETEPVGYLEQPWFLNQVCVGRTELYPFALLSWLKETEKELGRFSGRRFGPRRIDLDIIFYENWVLSSEILTLPHPRYRERAFVLQPLLEVLPEWRDPRTGVRVKDYWEEGKGTFSACRVFSND